MAKAEVNSSSSEDGDDRQRVAGRYRLHERIGSGRLGEIFEASVEDEEDAEGARRVAVQIVPETVVRNNRLFNQLNVGYSRLRTTAHPNLVGYVRFGRHGKCGYLAMELLDGISLRDTLDEVHALPMEETKPIVRAVGEALQMLHSEEMVHGNLTAKNVFITSGFGVRLLDVLPVDPSETIVRGRDGNNPFSRSTEQDDVFALACLAYEMLTGRHPFDNRKPQEARSEGLEPRVINSISDAEWKALRRALSFDRDQQTASVADFLHDFGVRGTERLQPPPEQAAAGVSASDAVSDARPQLVQATESAATPAMFDSTVKPIPHRTPDNARSGTARKPRRRMQTAILGVLLAALGSWFLFGQPREQFAELIAYLDANTRIDLVRSTESTATNATAGSVPADPVDSESPIEAGAADPVAVDAEAASTDVGAESASADPEVTGDEPEVDVAAAGDERPVAADPAESQPFESGIAASDERPIDDVVPSAGASLPDAPPGIEAGSAAEPGTEGTAADATLAPETAEAMPTEPVVSFDASVVQISERDGVIRISAPATAPSGKRVVWWTSGGSARTGEDFIGVEPQYVGEAPPDTGPIVLIVPLVNDSLPEPREAFDVNFGVYDAARVDIDRIATLRVEVVDDDGL
ncbi:MAG: protein kinase [Woeseiaceae bacterium]|nr:protein kinase [Woeseiaceae bacterium]